MAKTILEMKPKVVLFWAQLPEELKYYKKIFSSKAFPNMYDLKLFQNTMHGIPDDVHPTEGIQTAPHKCWEFKLKH